MARRTAAVQQGRAPCSMNSVMIMMQPFSGCATHTSLSDGSGAKEWRSELHRRMRAARGIRPRHESSSPALTYSLGVL